MSEPVRLAKRVAELVPCSRREAELYIAGGWVTVDGKVVEEPQFRVSGEAIAVDPSATLTEPAAVTILYHQGSIDQAPVPRVDNQTEGDPSGIRPLRRHFTGLSDPMPLQAGATGLVVLTQDWRVTRKLVDDAATVEQEYSVEVANDITDDLLKRLNRRITVRGKDLPLAKVSLQSERRLRVAMKGARPGHIALMCESAGVTLVSMRRLRIGRVAMSRMPAGEWRYLPEGERF